MNRFLFTVVYVLSCIALCLGLIASCNAAAQREAAANLQEFSTLLSETISDSVVTPEEGKALKDSFKKTGESLIVAMKPQSGVDWNQIISIGLAALLGGGGAVATVSQLPNRFVIGKAEAAHLDSQVSKQA